jgi:hypothetical protein
MKVNNNNKKQKKQHFLRVYLKHTFERRKSLQKETTTNMSRNLQLFFLVFILSTAFKTGDCFVPAGVVEYMMEKAEHDMRMNLGEVSETLVHEDIIRRGIVRSVARFLHEQKGERSKKVNIRSMEGKYYNDPRHMYHDYYNKWVCNLDLDYLIRTEFQPNVAVVDLDEHTKDLPYAHFDAETFRESNRRVMKFLTRIYQHLDRHEYHQARKLSGQILHTIQDFYSHSNWVEMGHHHKINDAIGTERFDQLPIATKSDTLTCISNCTLMNAKCTKFTQKLFSFISTMKKWFSSSKPGETSTSFSCPMKFYKCEGNIAVLDKLVSGYYVNQKLPNNVSISKPLDGLKCSHGGFVDDDSYKLPSFGGINKDSGFYLFSPHADLHLVAARLAIRHTEHFFNEIRAKIGDEEFNKFLKIKIEASVLETIDDIFGICSFSNPTQSSLYSIILPIFAASFLLLLSNIFYN